MNKHAPRTDWMARWARYRPDHVAIEWYPTGQTLTYDQCHRVATGLAHTLTARYHLQAGDRVAILALNSLEHIALFFACQRAGWVLVPVNFRLATPEVVHVLHDSTPSVLFYADDFAPIVQTLRDQGLSIPCIPLTACDARDNLRADVTAARTYDGPHVLEAYDFDTPCMILYTSGTTGRPKGAIISHGMLFWNAVNTTLRLDLTTADVSFNAAPFYHTGGWNVLTTPLLHHGAQVILLDRFDADALLRLCDARGITILWGVPTMMQMMADTPAFAEVSLKHVRYAIVGGEAMPEPLIRTWNDKGIPIRQGFGMTEVGPNCFSLPERDAIRKIGSIGFPNFYIDTRLVDDEGRDVPRGETGELLMRGPVVSPGYWNRPDATAASFHDGGWFATGDLLRQDDDGYFYVVGRKKDMYISGGENVYPAEVEKVLYAHPAIAQVAVVGVPDARWGEVGAAFVVRDEGAPLDVDAVTAHARAHLARYKVPKFVYFRDTLPVGNSGKVLKRALRDEALAQRHAVEE